MNRLDISADAFPPTLPLTEAVTSINYARVQLSDDPRCWRLIHDLERVSWKADGYGNLCAQLDTSDPELTHVSDALGYMVEREFGLRVATGLRPEFIG